MNKGKNNFTNEAVKEKSAYKLWICYDEQSDLGKKIHKNTGKFNMKYYGYNTKSDKGRTSLEKLVEERYPNIKVAILYDNAANKELKRWENPTFLTKTK